MVQIKFDKKSVTLHRQKTAPLCIHYAAPLIPVLLTVGIWKQFTYSSTLFALVIIFSVLLSIYIHELGHAYMGKYFGIIPSRIEIHPMGGWVSFHNMTNNPTKFRAIIFAGPFANILLAATCFFLMNILPLFENPPNGNSFEEFLRFTNSPIRTLLKALTWIFYINIALAIINLLPAYPLDGGEILHSFIKQHFDKKRALMIVGGIGIILSFLAGAIFVISIIAGAVIWSPPWLSPNLEAFKKGRQMKRPKWNRK